MKRSLVQIAGVFLFSVGLLSAQQASAATTNYGPPKPLIAEPSTVTPEAKPKINPNELPKELVEARQKTKDEFNAWLKDDNEIKKQCAAVHTAVERAACDKKNAASQARLDVVHAHMRDAFRKIDTWRRKQAGLPPPSWWPPENKNQRAGQSGGSGDGAQPKPQSPALLPSNMAPLPAGTF